MAGRQGREAERGEVGVGQGDGERRAVAEPPRAVGTAGGSRRQIAQTILPFGFQPAGDESIFGVKCYS